MKNYKTFLYIGESMKPLFKTGDLVLLKDCNKPKVGDVIVFLKQDSKEKIIHRVIKISKNSIITKGDNNSLKDKETINIKDVIGKVLYIKRDNKLIRIKRQLSIKKYIFKILSLIYHFLERFNIFNFIFLKLKIKYFIYYKGNKKELRLFLKDILIARVDLENKRFLYVKPPYRLVIPKNYIFNFLNEVK